MRTVINFDFLSILIPRKVAAVLLSTAFREEFDGMVWMMEVVLESHISEFVIWENELGTRKFGQLVKSWTDAVKSKRWTHDEESEG